MIDDKRLKEIKEGPWILKGYEEWTNQEDADTEAVIKELVAAYEQAWAELAYVEKAWKKTIAERDKLHNEKIDLRAQLEETQYKLRSCKSLAKLERENLLERNTDLISERKKAQDEADSAVQSMVNLRKQLAEAEERDDAMDIIGVADKRTIADLRKEVKRLKATNGGE